MDTGTGWIMISNYLSDQGTARHDVRSQVLTATSMKTDVFRGVAPCSLVDIDQHFRGAYCIHRQGDHPTSVTFTKIPAI
jgi:hypothetical protein